VNSGIIGLFRLNRLEDETGISGPGLVAYGAVFPNGKAVLAWCAPDRPQSVAVYDSLQDLYAIHVTPHGGKTCVEWGVWDDVEQLMWWDFALRDLMAAQMTAEGEQGL